MSINYAILGILSYKPMTGYDIKKIIQNSAFMYWSGNNNQIYKALSELQDKGMVTSVVKHQEDTPTRKVYEITNEGLAALKEWTLSTFEPTEIKKPFLIHLAWSKQLNTNELNMLIDEYEKQVKMQLLMVQGNIQNAKFSPNRTVLEETIWNFINDNIIRTYENELIWIEELREAISNIPNENDVIEDVNIEFKVQENINDDIIKYTVISNSEITYVHFNDTKIKFEKERNILDMIKTLVENNTHFVVLDCEIFSKNFFDLKNGLLVFLLQKLTMYNIKAAIIMRDHNILKSEIREAIAESKKNGVLRLFTDIKEAIEWFLSLKQQREL